MTVRTADRKESKMGDLFIQLCFATPRRVLGTFIVAMVLFAVISPEGFNWLMVRAFNALWPWIQMAGLLAVGVAVLVSIFRPKKGG